MGKSRQGTHKETGMEEMFLLGFVGMVLWGSHVKAGLVNSKLKSRILKCPIEVLFKGLTRGSSGSRRLLIRKAIGESY